MPGLLILAGTACSVSHDASLTDRVQVLEDREAIRSLLLDYSRHVDGRNWTAFADLFAEDGGTWDGGMGVARGQQAIIEMMENSIGNQPNVGAGGNGMSNLHLNSNEMIDVQGDSATALSKWVFVMTAEDGGPALVVVGHYDDQLVRENGQWKFQLRTVYADISRQMQMNGL